MLTMGSKLANQEALNASELHQALKTRALELVYEKSANKSKALLHDEDDRRARLRSLLLEEDNADLQERLMQEDARAADMERELSTTRELQSQQKDTVKQLEEALRKRSREVEFLQAELTALNDASAKSTKLLSEKLALAHELASLKPELEHLRAQASEYQTTLSEKLALQRELSTVEVELENQKRAAQQLHAKQSEDAAQDRKFEAQVKKLQKDLAKEKEARERVEREAQKEQEEEQSKGLAMETKLRTTKDKLRQLKAYLKEQEAASEQQKAYLKEQEVALEQQKAYLKEQEVALEQQKAYLKEQKVASEQQKEKPGPSALPAPTKPERRGKKRKLLGSGASKTLFDEEEAGPVRPLGKSLFGGGNQLPLLGGGAAGKKGGLAAQFSPLKKDKRASSSVTSSILR